MRWVPQALLEAEGVACDVTLDVFVSLLLLLSAILVSDARSTLGFFNILYVRGVCRVVLGTRVVCDENDVCLFFGLIAGLPGVRGSGPFLFCLMVVEGGRCRRRGGIFCWCWELEIGQGVS